MKWVAIVALLVLITATYPYWSYKEWAKRMDERTEREGSIMIRYRREAK